MKVQSSLAGVKIPKIQKFFEEGNDNKESNINDLDSIDFGDKDSDIENEDYDIYNTEANPETRISKNDKKNIIIQNNYFDSLNSNDNHPKHKGTIKKRNHYNNSSSIRANSK